ncbi:hypothetical protein QCA50_016195 [Cerrena zonata]|uniref:Uncharacterized protein n=1 Tax=Cerrena zonata TaxID=2478898 RepID=A0AAW0FPJ1_9APHY
MTPPNSLNEPYVASRVFLPRVVSSPSVDKYCLLPGRRGGRAIITAATAVACIGFVLQLAAGILCLRALLISRRKSKSKITTYLIFHTSTLWIINVTVLILATLAFQWHFGSMKLVNTDDWVERMCFPSSNENDNIQLYPEDSILLGTERLSQRLDILALLSNISFGISGVLSDAMLIWRCRQIWKFTLFSRPNLIVIFPIFLLAGSMVPLIYSCISDVFYNFIILSYAATTLALNLLLTTLIILRLWQRKTQLRKVLGTSHGRHYDVLSIVFVESASMNAIFSILFLASTVVMSQTMESMFFVWIAATPVVQACSNYLIIYRGSKGWYGSWSNDVTIANPSVTSAFRTSSSQTLENNAPDDNLSEISSFGH